MPFDLDAILPREPNDDLRATLGADAGWMPYANVASAIGVAAVAMSTFVECFGFVDHPWLLGLLLGIAAAPFVVAIFVDFPNATTAAITLGALSMQTLAGPALGVRDPGGRDQMSILILIWLVGQTASVGRRRQVIVVTTVTIVLATVRFVPDENATTAVVWVVGTGIALLAGLLIRTLTVSLVNSKIAENALREQATTEERQRIAREVHDVIAHSMTVTMLHLTAARMAVARGDSTAATEALEEAEKAGRTSLNEIRHTVGLLRDNDTTSHTAPLPSAVDVPELVARFRSAGVDAVLEIVGELHLIEPAAGLALYRIVQESLTNAGRHSPGARTVVRIDVGPPLVVDVQSDGGLATEGDGSGLGLAGMAERAAALGGRLEAGRSGNGWRVAATLP